MTTSEPTTAQANTHETAVIRFEDVSLHFGDTPALDHLSLELHAGQTYVVFGAAGSGKTSLLKVAAGLVKPDSGRVYLFGQDITGWKEQQLFDVRARIGILFQEGGLFDSLNIAENVAYPLLNQPLLQEGTAHGNGSGRPPRSVDERVREALRFVELEATLEKFPSELSGGMRRRVGIARAIVAEPALMLYDSPTAGLDPITANTIVSLIIRGRDLRNTATFMVTHRYQDGHLMANFRYNPNSGRIEATAGGDSDSASSSMNTRFLVMNQGRIAFEGHEAELQASTDDYVRKFLRIGGA
jgi:phospholipid/cholesterol/gamma-HCH transport system ATP-binding protein